MSFFVFVLNAIKGALTSSEQKPIKDKAYLVGVGFGSWKRTLLKGASCKFILSNFFHCLRLQDLCNSEVNFGATLPTTVIQPWPPWAKTQQ